MSAHTKQQFEAFVSQLQETNATLDFYCDFDKITANVAEIEISLNQLNYLIGKADLRAAVEALYARDKKAFDVMDILIATRKKDSKKYFKTLGEFKNVHDLFADVDGIMEFLEGTGLAKVFQEEHVKNLVDYVFGVETGLDTNARKNRSGSCMERIVAQLFTEKGVSYEEQVSSFTMPEIADVLGVDEKRFDFVIRTAATTYLIEVNFYSGGGSKLNEVARSYTDIAPKINAVEGYEFVWITDGVGWEKAKSKFEEAFYAIPQVYNLTTIHEFILSLHK